MNRILAILLLCFSCLVVRAATPSFTDFDPTQFNANPSGPQPKITLLISGTVSNYNITVLVSSNFFTTNITVETIQVITNVAFNEFVTNLYVTQSYITNLTVNYFTVQSNANIVGYIRDFAGIGTNTLLYAPTLVGPINVVNSNAPVVWYFLDANNSTILSGWDTNKGGFFGDGAGLTNLQGVITSPGSTFGWIIVTNGITNLLLQAVGGVVWADANGMLTNIPPQAPNTIYSGPTIGANAQPTFRALAIRDLPGGVAQWSLANTFSNFNFFYSITVTNGITNQNLNASQFVATDANKALASTLNGNTLTNLSYQYTTNPVAALNVPWQQALFTNIGANFTVTLSAPGAAFYESSIMYVTNSGGTDFKVTMPNGVWGPPGSGSPPAFFCTNKMLTTILVQHYGQLMTNAIKQDYAP